MKSCITTLLMVVVSLFVQGQSWSFLTDDPQGDGFFSFRQDAKSFEYRYDAATDSIWFKIDLHDNYRENDWGMNILLDTDLDPNTGQQWPSPTNPFSFDIALTVWVTGSPGNYSGTIGVSDAVSMMGGNFTSLYQNNIQLIVDPMEEAYIVGLPRQHLDSTDATFDVFASVGVSGEANDMIPNTGSVRIDELLNTIVSSLAQEALLKIYPNPAGEQIFVSEKGAYHLLNQQGILVNSGLLLQANGSISLAHLPAGTYWLQMQTPEGTKTTTILHF